MKQVFSKTSMLTDKTLTYCPGCTHGIVHRLVAEVLEELEIGKDAIGVAPVGCSVMCYEFFNCDMQVAAHGRAPAVATGIKRVHPDKVVFTYQGDGDLASIGTAETIHIATRGENITTIFINNAIYGMTGGQMAPTTLFDQKTTTSPTGRTATLGGNPLKMSEILATIDGVCYVERTSTHDPKHILATKKAIKKAFQNQLDNKGYSVVEVLSNCPTNWGMTPQQSLNWIEEKMIPVFPLGIKKEVQ